MTAPAVLQEKRLRWKSRRGRLELDLMLAGFWRARRDGSLTAAERALLAEWLDMDDDDLWALLNDGAKHANPESRALAEKITDNGRQPQ